MRPVATTRMEAVAVNAAGRKATAETGSAGGEVQPTYELVYRGHMDLAQAWEGPGVEVASAKMPKVIPLEYLQRGQLPDGQGLYLPGMVVNVYCSVKDCKELYANIGLRFAASSSKMTCLEHVDQDLVQPED